MQTRKTGRLTSSLEVAMLAIMAYPGGKGGEGVYQTIINQMPPHRVYIEPFLGGGAIMRRKKPATLNIGIDRDPEAIKAFPEADIAGNDNVRFRFESGDGLAFLRAYNFVGDELVYCDPPYLFETRSSDRTRYVCELGDARQHRKLLDLLTALPCMAMISGYWSRLYADRLHAWHSIRFAAMTHSGPRTEWLWSNFPEPVELHDYRHVGASFRERERIKRKKQRWMARLHRLPILERQALLAAISEAWRISSPQLTATPAAPSVSTMRAVMAGSDEDGSGSPLPLRQKQRAQRASA
jgi:DNA adenine methylase